MNDINSSLENCKDISSLPAVEPYGIFKDTQEKIWDELALCEFSDKNFIETTELPLIFMEVMKRSERYPGDKQKLEDVENITNELKNCNNPTNNILQLWYKYLGVDTSSPYASFPQDIEKFLSQMSEETRKRVADLVIKEGTNNIGDIQKYYYALNFNEPYSQWQEQVKEQINNHSDKNELINFMTKVYFNLFKRFNLIHDHIKISFGGYGMSIFDLSDIKKNYIQGHEVMYYDIFNRFSTEWQHLAKSFDIEKERNLINKIFNNKEAKSDDLLKMQYQIFGPRMLKEYPSLGSFFLPKEQTYTGPSYSIGKSRLSVDCSSINIRSKQLENLSKLSQFRFTKLTPGF